MSNASKHDSPRLLSALWGVLKTPHRVTLSPEEAVAFDEYRTTLMLDLWPRIGLLLAAAALLWWPLDWVVYAGRDDIIAAFARFRTIIIGLNLFGFLYSKTKGAKRWTLPMICTLIVMQSFFAGYTIRHLGGFNGPWVHYFNIFPIVTVLLFIRLPARVAIVFAMCTSCFFGLFFGNRQSVSHPDFPSTLTFQIFVVAFSSFLGHMAFELFKSDFVFRRRLDAKHREVSELAQQLESRVAAQTEDLRRLARRNEQIREEERRIIAREIHDQLGQMLTAIRYGLFYAKSKIHDAPEVAMQSINEALTLTVRTSETTRRLHTMLHPHVLEEFGLFGAVEWLAHELKKHSQLEIEIHTRGSDEFLEFDTAAAVFRTAQEGVTNILKHANARRAQLSIEVMEDRLSFRLRDDGNGFLLGKTGQGLGLIGIRERAHALQGQVHWTTSADGGFLLSLELPLPQRGIS